MTYPLFGERLAHGRLHRVTIDVKWMQAIAGSGQRFLRAIVILAWLLYGTRATAESPQAVPHSSEPGSDASGSELLTLPPADGPVVVKARFTLRDVNEVDDDAETFEFTGILALTWRDPRQSFDPNTAGVAEKLYQGAFQFNESSPAWYPQVVLANESGMYQKNAVLLRVLPDGTNTLIETVNAVAETKFNLRRLPFDRQALEAVFEVLGFDDKEVRLEVDAADEPRARDIRIPQWTLAGAGVSTRSRVAPDLGVDKAASQFVLRIDVERQSIFLLRLVVVPLTLIVALSWSVFWMDRASLGDRMSISFVGLLTAVAYQLVVADLLPNVSYVTLMHAILNVSFLLMAATVVVNLVVGAYDRAGRQGTGEAVDRACRWIFPLAYCGLVSISVAIAYLYL